jgi:acyl carrier protein
MTLTAENLLAYLDEQLAVDTSDIDPTTLLFSSGIIDSHALVQLIAYIEDRCGFRVSASEVTLDNLDSIERILAYVERASA